MRAIRDGAEPEDRDAFLNALATARKAPSDEVAAKHEFYQDLLMTTLAGERMADQLIALTETIIEEIEAAQK